MVSEPKVIPGEGSLFSIMSYEGQRIMRIDSEKPGRYLDLYSSNCSPALPAVVAVIAKKSTKYNPCAYVGACGEDGARSCIHTASHMTEFGTQKQIKGSLFSYLGICLEIMICFPILVQLKDGWRQLIAFATFLQ